MAPHQPKSRKEHTPSDEDLFLSRPAHAECPIVTAQDQVEKTVDVGRITPRHGRRRGRGGHEVQVGNQAKQPAGERQGHSPWTEAVPCDPQRAQNQGCPHEDECVVVAHGKPAGKKQGKDIAAGQRPLDP